MSVHIQDSEDEDDELEEDDEGDEEEGIVTIFTYVYV